jgi:hypothetical protein
MTAPHSSARYAVIRGSLIGAPTGVSTYSVVAVHEVWADSMLVSQLAVGSPMSFSAPTIIANERVIAMLAKGADAVEYAGRLRREDMQAER